MTKVDNPEIAGPDLAEARVLAGLSQPELAQALGVTRGAVAQWEAAAVPRRRVAAVLDLLGEQLGWLRVRHEPGMPLDWIEWQRFRAEGRAETDRLNGELGSSVEAVLERASVDQLLGELRRRLQG